MMYAVKNNDVSIAVNDVCLERLADSTESLRASFHDNSKQAAAVSSQHRHDPASHSVMSLLRHHEGKPVLWSEVSDESQATLS